MDKAELFRIAHDTVVNANEERALQLVEEAREAGVDLLELLREGFARGNQEVGDLFERGLISLPELIFSTEVTRKVIEMVEDRAGDDLEKIKGKVLMATVSGDVHEIGKGMVASTMISNGIEVIDLGREVSVETIIEKAEEHGVDIIATSALLTSTLKEQKKLEDALRAKGLRDKYITMVGGAPCTQRWAKRIGADAYSEDAIEAVKVAIELLKNKYD